MTVRAAGPADADGWLRLRRALWPEGSEEEHREEIERYFAGTFPRNPWEVLLAVAEDGRLLGFAELSLRPYAEGCASSPVAYLEGWYVVPDARGRGVGKALVAAAEDWGREQGCSELASDTAPDNEASLAAHGSAGFERTATVVCLRKEL